MIGGWMWLAQWARKIDQKRKERTEQRESLRKRRKHHAGSPELRQIKLTEAEKRELRAKIPVYAGTGQTQKITRSSRINTVIYVYMAIMMLGVTGNVMIIFIRQDVGYPMESVESMLSCLVVVAFCVLWLKLSRIRKSRGLAVMIPGVILFVLSSGFVGFGIVPLRSRNVIVSLFMGVPALVASYLLCFGESKNADS